MLLYWEYFLYPRGRAGVTFPPLFVVVNTSCALSVHCSMTSCLLDISVGYLFRSRPSAPMWLRDSGGLEALLVLGISWRTYLKRLTPEPSSHCGLCTLILCACTLDLQMHWCVACIKVMAILLLTCLQVLE